MKEEDNIKKKEYPRGEGLENCENNTVGKRIGLVTKFKRDIYKN